MDVSNIGKLIKDRRKFLKIFQKDLAEISGISERTLRDIERGVANPELKTLVKIGEVLGFELKIEVIK